MNYEALSEVKSELEVKERSEGFSILISTLFSSAGVLQLLLLIITVMKWSSCRGYMLPKGKHSQALMCVIVSF